jgi:hypothetical protein
LGLSVINIAILTAVLRLIRSEGRQRFVQGLLAAFTVLTFLVALSSFYRMRLYEAEYGYTVLRLHVFMFLYFEFGVLVVYLIRIFSARLPIYRILFMGGLAFYLVLNYMSTDAFVARKNIDRYFETGKVDTEYLSLLGADAQGEIIRLAGEENWEIQRLLAYNKRNFSYSIYTEKDWRMYNRAAKRAYQMYQDVRLIDMTCAVEFANESMQDLYDVRIVDENGDRVTSVEFIEAGQVFSFDSNASYFNIEFVDEEGFYHHYTVNPDVEEGNQRYMAVKSDGTYGLQVFPSGEN